jgi:hypothetical protein
MSSEIDEKALKSALIELGDCDVFNSWHLDEGEIRSLIGRYESARAPRTISAEELELAAQSFHKSGEFAAKWDDIKPWSKELYRVGLKSALATLGITVGKE